MKSFLLTIFILGMVTCSILIFMNYEQFFSTMCFSTSFLGWISIATDKIKVK